MILQEVLHDVDSQIARYNILTICIWYNVNIKMLNGDNEMIFREEKEESTPIRFNTPEDLYKFVENEDPYCGITEEEKTIINNIGCSLNNAIRSGYKLDYYTQRNKDLLQRLIQTHILKEDIIVNRAVRPIEHELTLASIKGLPPKHLFNDGFVYTSLLPAYPGQIHLNILIPKGTPYLYTGVFSNTIGTYPHEENQPIKDIVGELILDIGTIFKIDKRRRCRCKGITIYDVHVVDTGSSVIK